MSNPLRNAIFAILAGATLTACQEPADGQASVASAPTDSQAAKPTSPATPQAEARALTHEEASEALSPSTFCNLEYAGEALFSGEDLPVAGTAVRVKGWVGHEVARTAPADPVLRVEAAGDKGLVWQIPLSLGVVRDDIARDFSAPGISDAGFEQEVSLAGIPAGRYHLYLSYSNDGVRYGCDNGRHILIEG